MLLFTSGSTTNANDVYVSKNFSLDHSTGTISVPDAAIPAFTVSSTDGVASTTTRNFTPLVLNDRNGDPTNARSQLSNANVLTFAAATGATGGDQNRLRSPENPNGGALPYTNDPDSFTSVLFTSATGIGGAFVIPTDAAQAFANNGGSIAGTAGDPNDALTIRSGKWVTITAANVNSDVATLRALPGSSIAPPPGTSLFLFDGEVVTPAIPSSAERLIGSLNEIARGDYVEI